MLNELSYDLELLATNRPQEIKVNGVVYQESNNGTLGTWKYEPYKRITRVYLPKTPRSQRTEIVTRFVNETAATNPSENSNKTSITFSSSENMIKVIFPEFQKDISLKFLDLKGNIIFSKKFENQQKIEFPLPFTIDKGVYVLIIDFDNKKQTEKLIF
ncbi:hypothetical protein MASR2M117_00900 [Paludibacter sp.]